jgi:hypothetical protein
MTAHVSFDQRNMRGRRPRLQWLCVFLLFCFCGLANAQTPQISLVPFLSGLTQPVLLRTARDGTGRLFIVEQVGRIRSLGAGVTTPTLFLDISSRVRFNGEQGLLGLAFHPQFASNGRFYVNYTRQPDGATVVAEYRNGAEQRVLFVVPQPYENHNGGMIEFGPDGYLYIGMGDGGSGNDPENRAQNPNELLGKMLRINVDLTGSQPEIFASGLRNPWRYSFDRLTGLLWAGDVGQSAREEIDIITQGSNYGWRVWEGTFCTGLGPAPCSTPGFTPPIADYVNTGSTGRCAIIGGYVYRGTQATFPYGAYIYGDLCSGEIFMFKDGVQAVLIDTSLSISSFGEDDFGELYVLDINGPIYRLINNHPFVATTRPFAIGDRGAFVASTAGSASALSVGYGRIQVDAGQPLPPGLAIFDYRQSGVLVSEATVPASPAITSGRILAEITPNVNTGIAIANPINRPATISFYFTDANGATVKSGTTIIPGKGQLAAFLSEAPFNGGNSFFGTFTFTTSLPIAAIALRGFTNERSEFLITTLPVFSTGTAEQSNATIAHFADGGGWSTQVLLINPFDSPVSGIAQFFNAKGQVVLTSAYSLAPRSATRFSTSGTNSAIQTGSVNLSTPVPAVSIFSFRSNNVTINQAGMPTTRAGTAFRTYVETGPAVRSGIAIANPSENAVDVNLEVGGLTTTLSLPPYGQISQFLNEIQTFAGLPSSFQGTLRITSGSPVAVTGLRGHTNERGDFLVTTTPPTDESATSTAIELFFPHFVEGGGYSMQFIFFGRSTSGTLYFFNSSGDPISLLFP